ncbi:MAG: TatD family hydrolase [Arachnia sp.]
MTQIELPALPEPLPRPVVDNHTHLAATQAYSGLSVADSIAKAASVAVTRMVEVGTDVASSQEAISIARATPSVVAAVALHPNDAARAHARGSLEAELAAVEQLVSDPAVRAVGETGLDHFRTRDAAGHAAQVESFAAHIGWAKRHDLTLVIHDRDAHDDVLAVLDRQGAPDRVVMHCFSGDADFARACLERGFWLSLPGVVTFGSAQSLRQAALVMPLERILVETDAPYLAPHPCRGRPNASYLMPHTVRFLADLLDVELAELCDRVSANTDAAYGGTWQSHA